MLQHGKITPKKPMELVRVDKIAEVRKQVQFNEWAEMVRTCRDSGMSVRRWCIENGASQKTYYSHLRRFREFLCEKRRDIVPIDCDIPAPVSSKIKIQSDNMNIPIPCSVSLKVLSAAIEALKC